jgi:hypothetical protein
MQIHPVFHVSLLEKHSENRFPARQIEPPPPPIILPSGTTAYEAEKILNSRIYQDRLDYFVHWKGYPIEDRTWAWASDWPDDHPLVVQFHTQHPDRPGHNRIQNSSSRTRRARA